MLQNARAAATIPAKDLKRARAFYSEKLGLSPKEERADGLVYELAGGTGFLLFQSSGAPSGTHTQLGFDVKDVAAEVKELKARGLKFEEYDSPGLKTVDGIAEMGGVKGAWFKDSEGNLLAIGQEARVEATSRS
jgi:predicted enzyme related to lactoylglutathione lyase